MRARRHRPLFDSLDVRLVLSDTAAVVAPAVTPPPVDASLQVASPEARDLLDILDWYLPGNPPPDTPDPTIIPIPWDQLGTT